MKSKDHRGAAPPTGERQQPGYRDRIARADPAQQNADAAGRSAECELREHLAAAFRLAAQYDWQDQLATHMSLRLPGAEPRFLINPYGLFFEEVTASSLVVVDLEGNLLTPAPYGINKAGFIIHSAIHRARADAHCVIHLHTIAGTAVAAQAGGLLPISPGAMYFDGRLGYHDWEGVTVVPAEQTRLVAQLGDHLGLMLRNHGTLTIGRSVGEAFERMYVLEKACRIQVAAQSGNAPLVVPPRASVESVFPSLSAFGDIAAITWEALLRRVERTAPDYRD